MLIKTVYNILDRIIDHAKENYKEEGEIELYNSNDDIAGYVKYIVYLNHNEYDGYIITLQSAHVFDFLNDNSVELTNVMNYLNKALDNISNYWDKSLNELIYIKNEKHLNRIVRL